MKNKTMLGKIIDWLIIKLFGWYLLYVRHKVLTLQQINKLEKYIWNRYFAKDFHKFVEKNT